MSDTQVAIKVDSVYKNFRLPHEKVDSLKSAFVNPFRRSVKVETQHALKDISFEVFEGEFFGIVGRNGSGKSTLLRILAEIYRPTKGKVSTKGKVVPFIELGVGFNPELTGRENVYLNGALLGFSEKEIAAMYDDIVDFAELGAFMDKKLKNYSSGMQVRLAFSVATRSKADVLLIDEVLAVGDADFQRKCFSYFKELKKSKTTVIFVTHDMEAVREYCDRAMLIEKSELKHIGSTKEITRAYSRLFTAASQAEKPEDSKRWGSGDCITSDIKAVVADKEISLELTISAKVEMHGPVVGIRIMGQDGKEVTGTNTRIEAADTGALKAGETKRIFFTFPNVLSDGNYSVDPAILADDGITVLDWWNGAVQFDIRKSRRLPYVVDPGFAIEVKK